MPARPKVGGGPNLSSKACCPFFDVMQSRHLAGLPPAPWSGGQLSVSRSHNLSYQLAASSLPCVWSSQWIIGNFPHTGRLGLPCTPHGFLFLARGTTPHSAHCCASYSDLNVTLTHVASTSLFKTTFSVAP